MARGDGEYQIRLWGEVGVERLRLPLSRRARALLAHLALLPDGIERPTAAALLWPERSDAQALGNLRQLLHDYPGLCRGDAPLIIVSRDRLALCQPPPGTDDAALYTLADVPEKFADALARLQLPYLGGTDGIGEAWDNWVATERVRAQTRLGATACAVAQTAIDRGDPASARAIADYWRRFDACDEAMARLGLAADAAAHDAVGVQRRMAALTAALATELDVAPAPKTRLAAGAALAAAGSRQDAPATAANDAQPSRALSPRRWLAVGAAMVIALSLLWLGRLQPPIGTPMVAPAETARAVALTAAARQLLAQRTRGGYARDAELARAAIAHDPGYAPAYVELAIALWMPAWWADQEVPGARARIKRDALGFLDRALALSPGLPRALAAKGMILAGDDGRRLLEAAVASNPADADIWLWTAGARAAADDFDAALAAHARAREIAPGQQRMVSSYVQFARMLGRNDLADAAITEFARSSADRYSVHFMLTNGLVNSGRLGDAAVEMVWLIENGPIDRQRHTLNLLYLGRAAQDRAAIRRLANAHPQLGSIYAHLYDPAGAQARSRGREREFMASVFADQEARSLLAVGKRDVLLALYDARDKDLPVLTGCCAPGSMASSLIPALRSAGRKAEADAMLAALAAEVQRRTRAGEGDYGIELDRFILACLEHDTAAAALLGRAIDHGWRAQDSAFAVDPADEPACAALVGTPAFETERGRLLRLIAVERPRILASMAAAERFLRKNPPVTPPADAR